MSVARDAPVCASPSDGPRSVWLLAVLLLVAGRSTPAPLLPGVHLGVAVGAAVFTLVGAGQHLRRGYRWLAT